MGKQGEVAGKRMSSTRREGRTREVPWDDLPANTEGLVTGVCKLRLTRLNGLAMILVRPAGVVANTSRRALNFTCGGIVQCRILDPLDLEGLRAERMMIRK